MCEGLIASKLANKMFEKEVFKIVKKHAFLAAITAGFLSYFIGIWQLIFIYILWHMYNSICEKVGTTLNWKNILTGIVVNIIVSVVIGFIPIANIIIVYIQFYFSGKLFIEALKEMKN